MSKTVSNRGFGDRLVVSKHRRCWGGSRARGALASCCATGFGCTAAVVCDFEPMRELHCKDCANHARCLPRFRFAQISSVLSFFNAAPIALMASCEYRLCTDFPILNSL